MIKISDFVKCWCGVRGSAVCVVLLAVGICSAAAEGVPYEEELGISAGEVIDVIFDHGKEEEMYGAILDDREYEEIYGPLARFIAFTRTVPREVLDDREAFLAALDDHYGSVRERGGVELELDPNDVPPPRVFSSEEIGPPMGPDGNGIGIQENSEINLVAEQAFALRGTARILQRAMPNAFYLVAAAGNCSNGSREIGDKFGEESFSSEKGWSLWGSIGRIQGYTKNHISHRDRIFTGMIGCNFSNFYGKSFGIFAGVSNADIYCTGQNRGTSGQQSGVCVGAYGCHCPRR
jgi:hypothetical protein